MHFGWDFCGRWLSSRPAFLEMNLKHTKSAFEQFVVPPDAKGRNVAAEMLFFSEAICEGEVNEVSETEFMRSRTALMLALVLVLLVRSGAACLWSYTTNLDGRVDEIISLPPGAIAAGLIGKQSRESWLTRADELKQRSAKQPEDHELRNDYAVMLVRAGELNEALAVLNDIEATKPGLYPTAANLGTVYELSGDVEKSLFWIQEGLARNPQSHNGSEWLHVRILQAKQKLAEDPDWLHTHSILGLNFGEETRPTQPSAEELAAIGGTQIWDDLASHLNYQLRERTSLVDPPDAIVADLLCDLSNVLALKGQLENAIAVAELAERYVPLRGELLQRRLKHFRKIVHTAPRPLLDHNELLKRGLNRFVIGLSLGSITFLMLIAWWLRRRRRLKTVPVTRPPL